MDPAIFLLPGIMFIAAIIWISSQNRRIEQLERDNRKIRDADTYAAEVRIKADRTQKYADSYRQSQEKEIEKARTAFEQRKALLANMLTETKREYPWVAEIYEELVYGATERIAENLERQIRPAMKSAEKVREHHARLKDELMLSKFLAYKARAYESAFPHLADLFEDAPVEYFRAREAGTGDNTDPIKKFLSDAEYNKLSPTDRSQMALDRYLMRGKSNWEIGLDFERYVGYLYESEGWRVLYFGATERIEDLGRDLICKREDKTHIIQCKYWSSRKEIHENVVYQLLGTIIEYCIEESKAENFRDILGLLESGVVSGKIFTKTVLSNRAKQACDALNIHAEMNHTISDYPRIKCNVGKDGQKIYHLPFDQQYDRIRIEPEKGEFYAYTALMAEESGFRRAYRWRGQE